VRKWVTAVLVAGLSFFLAQTPIFASPAGSPSVPLGVVVSAENSNLGAGVTNSGATVYDGDRLQTESNATLRVRLASGQLVLRQNTTADVHAIPNGFSANLDNGTVVVSSPQGQTFQLIADGATIRPANAQPTSGQISMISATELILTSTHGTLEVSMGDEVKTVEAGNSYRMEIESDTEDSGPGPQGSQQKPRSSGRNRFLFFLIPGVAALTTIIIWRALVSPSAPGQ
jgi:hypothetical protein